MGNVAGYCLLRTYYARAEAVALFPSNSSYYRKQNALLPAKSGRRIVLFGDSRVARWGSFPRVEGFEVVNRGMDGETTAQMRTRFQEDVLALDPDFVVLEMGINDLVGIAVLPQRREEIVFQCAENMRHFVDELSSRKIRAILLTVIPPAPPPFWRLPVWSRDIAVEAGRLNRYWIDLSATPMLRVIDTESALMDSTGRWRENVNADTLHLTLQGYQYLNAAILQVLRE
ncbi:MAG: GDSL-type esterase/lipase family protein [Betaproteobacteria bacterium]